MARAATASSRLWKFLRSPDFRRHPLRSVRRRILWRTHWRFWPRRPFVVKFFSGTKLRLAHSSASSGVYLNSGYSDMAQAEPFMEFLRPGMTAVDCGAHIGEYTVLFAVLVGEGGAVHAFEPSPEVFPFLQENVRVNRLRNVTLNQAALSDATGQEPFIQAPDPTAAGLARFVGKQTGPTVNVRAMTLDEYAETMGIRHVDAIKIDAEGSELAVLRGSLGILKRFRPGLAVVECESAGSLPLVDALFASHGYTISRRSDVVHRFPSIVARH